MDATTITLSLPTNLLRDVERIARQREISLETLMTETIAKLVELEADYNAAKEDHLSIMAQSFNLGTQGKPLGPRDDLHERR